MMQTQAAIDRLLQNRRALKRRPRTIQWYDEQLRRFARHYPKLPTKPEAIENFLLSIRGEPETAHGYYRALKALYRFLNKRYGVRNPIEQISPPSCPEKVRPTLTTHELARLLVSATTLRDRAILTLTQDNGARAGEIASLHREDIGLETIRVTGKRGQREIPFSEQTRRLLVALVNTDGNDDGYVFMGQHGPLTRSGIYRIVRLHMQKAGIPRPKLGPSRIRHAFGRNYIVNGGDTRSLQRIMGHKHITTTEKYVTLAMEDIIQKHHEFTPLRGVLGQQGFWDENQVLKEAEEIVTGGTK